MRYARRAGARLPPYEAADALARLDDDITATGARMVISLGDAFDDMAAAGMAEDHRLWLMRMTAGRRRIWIAGNHDPGPLGLGGEHRAEARIGPLGFRHIAEARARREFAPLPPQGKACKPLVAMLSCRWRTRDPASPRHLYRRAAQ